MGNRWGNNGNSVRVELMLLNYDVGEDSWESLGQQSWIFIGRTDAEAETPILCPPNAKNWLIWKDPDAGKDWRQEEKGTTEGEMVGCHHWLDGHEFEQVLGIGDDREAWSAAVHGVTKSKTRLSDWTELTGGCWQWMTDCMGMGGQCCTGLSRSAVSHSLWPHDCSPPGSPVHGDSPGQDSEVDCHVLLQGIFPTQGSNPGCCIAGRFFTIWATREASWEGKDVRKFYTFCSVLLWIYSCSKKYRLLIFFKKRSLTLSYIQCELNPCWKQEKEMRKGIYWKS